MVGTYHSSSEDESVKVGVGLRFRLARAVLLSSTEATASLSARLFRLLEYDDDAIGGGGDAETLR